MRVISAAADQAALDLEARNAFRVEPVDDAFDFARDFGADAVAGQEKELEGSHEPVRVEK